MGAGELLAAVGPLEPHAVAFYAGAPRGGGEEAAGPPGTPGPAGAPGKRSSGGSTSGQSKSSGVAVVAALPAVLTLLAAYLLDDDVAVISATQMALRCASSRYLCLPHRASSSICADADLNAYAVVAQQLARLVSQHCGGNPFPVLRLAPTKASGKSMCKDIPGAMLHSRRA